MPPCEAAIYRDSDTVHSWRPAHNLRPANPPSRSARTTADAGAIRCRDRSADSTPASAGCAANWCPRASSAAAAQRTDPTAVAHRDDRRASTRPIGAGDATSSIKPHLHAKAFGVVRHRLLSRKQGKLPMSPARFVERFDLMTPCFALAIIDLTQIQKRPLHHPTARTAPAFDNAPVTVFLAVLPSPCESQVHGPRFYAQTKSPKEGRSSLHAFPPHRPLKRFRFRRRNSKIGAPVGKVGLEAPTRGQTG